MLIVGYAFRYEPDWMIEDLEQNMSWADGFAAYDTSNATETWVPAADRTATLYEIALNLGRMAGEKVWFLQAAPDERLEDRAGDVIHSAIADDPETRFIFQLRELWTPDQYRVDGRWRTKERRRLYQLDENGPVGTRSAYLNLNLYHLKMIEPENRRRRVEVFNDHNTWDNKSRGFDYLNDETGLRLETIPMGRGYSPPYRTYDFQVPGYQ